MLRRSNSLCNLCVLCVSVVYARQDHHRGTEDTEVAQRRKKILRVDRELGCALCDERCIECRCPLDHASVSWIFGHFFNTSCCCSSFWAGSGSSSVRGRDFIPPT